MSIDSVTLNQARRLSPVVALPTSAKPPMMCLLLCQILPGVRVIIVNPETRGPLGDSHLGEVSSSVRHLAGWREGNKAPERSRYSCKQACVCRLAQIWVSSPHSASGYYTIYGEESLQADHFNTRLSFGEPHTLWARTGYLGFIKRTELLDASGGERNNTQWEERSTLWIS